MTHEKTLLSSIPGFASKNVNTVMNPAYPKPMVFQTSLNITACFTLGWYLFGASDNVDDS